jgi:hypothetical protein
MAGSVVKVETLQPFLRRRRQHPRGTEEGAFMVIQRGRLRCFRMIQSFSLAGPSNGWVGIAPDGRIVVYSFSL